MEMRGGCCPQDGGKEAMRGGGITLDDSPDAGRLYDKQTKCAASEAPLVPIPEILRGNTGLPQVSIEVYR
jgi:hypothetical protein